MKEYLIPVGATGLIVAYCTAKGRTDVAAAFSRVVMAQLMAGNASDVDHDLVQQFALNEAGTMARTIMDVAHRAKDALRPSPGAMRRPRRSSPSR